MEYRMPLNDTRSMRLLRMVRDKPSAASVNCLHAAAASSMRTEQHTADMVTSDGNSWMRGEAR
jgi:hypothetical protein